MGVFLILKPIPDHLHEGLKILFVGYNPSIRSGETGHHYANPNNRFWNILYQSGITPRKFKPEEDMTLLQMGYGFTNIVARPTRTAAEISKVEYEEGRNILIEKIQRYRPRVVCFVGKGVYEQYSGKKKVDWGIQPDPIIPEINEFVGPSSSGLVRMRIDEVVEIYKRILVFL